MQVILLEKMANLGQLGDVVKVKDGFARNYLIPHGKAKRATAQNLAEFDKRRAELEKAQAEALAAAQERAAKLDGLMVQITQKAGVDGKLFGSVTNMEIAAFLKGKGFEIDRKTILLAEPIKHLGEFDVAVKIHPEVSATLKVTVSAA